MELTVYGPLRSATGEKTVSVDPDGETVLDVIEAFVNAHPRTASQLLNESGAIRPSVRVMVSGEKVAAEDTVSNTESVKLFPAMRGG
ncbi:MAG: ubiquitin-like small modifier protein 1 [Halobacteriota archaeon]